MVVTSATSARRKERDGVLSAISIASSRNKFLVFFLVLALTGILGYGVTFITTDVDVADVLPRGDPNTAAAKNITAKFKSAYTQQGTVAFHVDPALWQEDAKKITSSTRARTIEQYELGAYNITDEVYVRAMEEFFTFVEAHTEGKIQSSISVPGFYKLINWTVAGGKDQSSQASYSLPPSSSAPGSPQTYDSVHVVVRATIGPDVVDAIISPSYQLATMLLLVDPKEELSSRDIGKMFLEARDAYNEWAPDNARWQVFTGDNTPLFIVDSPIANAHASALTQEDLTRLGPIILAFLLITLYIAFRNTKSVVIAGSTLLIGVVWTYGAMGYMRIPMNTLNLTIVPLILGVGIDYTVHMINEFLEHKSHGLSDLEAFRIAGGRSGAAMLIATLTTVIGLGVMMLSPSLLLAQLGLLSAIAILVIYVLTITFIPATLSMIRDTAAMGASFKPSGIMPAWGANVSAHRVLWSLVLVLVTFVTLVNVAALDKEAFGDPGSNFPESDPLRQEHESSLIDFYDTPTPQFKTNVLVFEGDITDPEAHRYIQAIADNLATKPSVRADTLRSIVIAVDSWLIVREGGPGVVQALASEELYAQTGNEAFDQYPKTREEMDVLIDEMFASPFKDTVSLFIDYPDNGITTMTFAVKARTFEDAEEAWQDVWESVDEAEALKPADVTVAFVGNTATNFLFIDAQLPWLNYMSMGASIAAIVLVALFTRDLRATVTVALLMVITTVWFLGILPWIGVGLAITLMLPMVFIFNIGTDYAVHLVWNLQRVPDPREVFANVGKAILFSAITTIGAFAFFIPTQNVAMSKTMVATTIAIIVIFFATMIVVALFYTVPPKRRSESEAMVDSGEVRIVARPRAVPAEDRPSPLPSIL